jgi:sphinganine-1-phosphate aldolase
VLNLMKEWREREHKFNEGKAFGGIYCDDEEHHKFLDQVYVLYSDSNALFPAIFPGLRKFEAEVVRIACNLLGGDEDTCGTMTCGGTESIMMVCKAYRERALDLHGITEPEMVVPQSAHPAFAKGAKYFGIKLVVVPVDQESFTVSPAVIKAAMTARTVMVVVSAPTFPQGVIDPVVEVAAFTQEAGVPLHVDCCLGGFLLPWLRRLGHLQKQFDFGVPGVTSISSDIHKYGFGPKGTSVVMYRNSDYRQYQYFTYTEWSGGIYCSPSATGSRPGGLIAAAWAGLVTMGADGFMANAQKIHEQLQLIKGGLRAIPALRVLGDADAACISYAAQDPGALNIFMVADAIEQRGYTCNRLQKPECIQVQVGVRSGFSAEQYIKDVADSVAEVLADPTKFKDGTAPLYGMAATMPDRSIVGDLMVGFMDRMLDV